MSSGACLYLLLYDRKKYLRQPDTDPELGKPSSDGRTWVFRCSNTIYKKVQDYNRLDYSLTPISMELNPFLYSRLFVITRIPSS